MNVTDLNKLKVGMRCKSRLSFNLIMSKKESYTGVISYIDEMENGKYMKLSVRRDDNSLGMGEYGDFGITINKKNSEHFIVDDLKEWDTYNNEEIKCLR